MVLYALVMDMEQMNHALLKVKCYCRTIRPESMPFEEYINRPSTSIKIDFPNGRSLMEPEFRSIEVPIMKVYLEFFDAYDTDHMMQYLLNKNSNYRATSLDGTILRPSLEDLQEISSIPDEETETLKEYVFVEEKKGFFQKIKKMIQKKDN